MTATRRGYIGSPGNESAHQIEALLTAMRHDTPASSKASRTPALRLSASETGAGGGQSASASAAGAFESPMRGDDIS